MNSPTHVVANLLCAGRGRPELLLPVALGAFAPDAPMFVLYAFERFVFGRPEEWIWTVGYYQAYWQDTVDLFNSLPLTLVAAVIALALKRRAWAAFFASMAVHALCDLLVHHGDAHRHFWPLSDWRFASPVSYWEPQHYGRWFSAAELVLGVAGALWLRRTHAAVAWMRRFAVALLVSYAALIAVVVFVWRG